LKYYDLINKRIDKRTENFKGKLIKLNNAQGKDLLDKIGGTDFTKKKAIGKKVEKIISDFFDSEGAVYSEFAFPFIQNYAKSAGKEALAMINPGQDFIYTDALKKALNDRADLFGLSVNSTTRDKITQVIADGIDAGEGNNEISDRISAVYSDFSTARADMIARTETTAGNNEGTLAGFKQSSAELKEWIATADDRTRDSHAEIDGEIVALDEKFGNGLMFPGDGTGDPGETINCRCVIAPATSK
jgi:SPP1 gp7 family putative phage head morphogenesis protein